MFTSTKHPTARNRFLIRQTINSKAIEHDIRVRTTPNIWVNTTDTVVIPISIHSAFHDNDGFCKISSLMRAVKLNAKGKVVVLFCEGAHVNVLSLKHENDVKKALRFCRRDAEQLFEKYKSEFLDCEVVYWHDFIMQDKQYDYYKNLINSLVNEDQQLKIMICNEIEDEYKGKLVDNYPDRYSYMKMAFLDRIEMIVGEVIMYSNKCRYQLYPGKMHESMYYVRDKLCPELVFSHIKFTTIAVTCEDQKNSSCPSLK